jgi:hypothetical protein
MKNNKFSLYFILISFFTFITVFIFLIQKSYFNLLKPQRQVENNALLNEIDPNLDLSIISEIELKNKNIEENFDFSILYVTPTPISNLNEELDSSSDLDQGLNPTENSELLPTPIINSTQPDQTGY